MATTVKDVHTMALYLVVQFPVINHRAEGAYNNPSMGPISSSGWSVAPSLVSELTAKRIAVALKRVVSLLAGHFGQADPYVESSLDDSFDGDEEADDA
jgi:hypothetical protein